MAKFTPEGTKIREMIRAGHSTAEIMRVMYSHLEGKERDAREASIRATRSQVRRMDEQSAARAHRPAEPPGGELVQLHMVPPAPSFPAPPSAPPPAPPPDPPPAAPPPQALPAPPPRARYPPPRPAEYVHQPRIAYLKMTIRKLEENADLSTGDQTTRALKAAMDAHKELDKLLSERDGKTVTDPAMAEEALVAMLPQMSDAYLERALEEYLRRNPSLTVQVA